MGRSCWFAVGRDSKENSQLGLHSSVDLWNNPYMAFSCMDLFDGEKKLIPNFSRLTFRLTFFNRERSLKLNLSLPRLSGKCMTHRSHKSPKFHSSFIKCSMI